MSAKRIVAALCFAIAAMLVTEQAASAARIYNFLQVKVQVWGSCNRCATQTLSLEPGQNSGSLSWPQLVDFRAVAAYYDRTNPTVCKQNWDPHAEIQGGNYMVITQKGHIATCFLCNASHNLMAVTKETLPDYIAEYTSPYQGC